MAQGPGTTTVITGANAGLGLATAVGVARTGANVILAVRSTTKGAAAVTEIRQAVPAASVEVMQLDLASLESVRAFAGELSSRIDALDVLVNNAGVTMKDRSVTADGFETTFGVNHLGHFALTNLLHDLLSAATEPRVVVVASDAHRFVRKGLDFSDLHGERKYGTMRAYGASKLANMLFTLEAARRWQADGITVNCLHPGFVATRIGRDGDGGRIGEVATTLLRPFAKTPERGARTSVFLATAPEPAGVTGKYFVNSQQKLPMATALDEAAAARLWQVSNEMVGIGD